MSSSTNDGREGSKRLLALDGGGIRGLITLEILAHIEATLRKRLKKGDNFVLADYFHYIAGTSTGGIIAAGLSLGWPVSKVIKLYEDSAEAMFDKASVFRRHKTKYKDAKLSAALRDAYGPNTLFGSDKLKTLLMLVLRNATTDSPWPLSNNPKAAFNQGSLPDNNLNLPLWQLVRASTAAPTYFPPELVNLGDKEFIFVDGGITPFNNPAFQLFLMATLEQYRLQWPTGEDRMLIVSVGTGTSPEANADLAPGDMNLLYNASSIPSALMFAALNQQDMLCRTFGRCRAGLELDLELGDFIGTKGPQEPRLFTYMRYNVELTDDGLAAVGCEDVNPGDVQQLDSVKHMKELQKVGAATAKTYVKAEHFDGFV